MTDLVFITGAGRCGTNLVSGIYDSHEKFNVFPGELPFSEVLAEINLGSCIISDKRKEILDFFLKDFKKDKLKFKKKFYNKKNFSFHIKFLISELSLFYFKKKNIILINTQNENIDFLLKNFKKSKIIHMIRNPLTQINSRYLFRHGDCTKRYSGNEFPNTYFRNYQSFKQAYKYKKNKNVLIVKIEDLTGKSKKTLHKMNKFLKIKNFQEPKLTRFNGKFISTLYGKKIETTKIVNVKMNYSCLLPYDLYCINKIKFAKFFYKLKKFKYANSSIFLYYLRHFGLIGKNRVTTLNIINLIKLFIYTYKNYKDDLKIKENFLKFCKNEK